ncbi:autotransporter domain-containing protein [Sphingomonas sp. MMS24-J13]|uniref:autotransporter domain-containing protein n=1 Tax=Sphingomonas sp. MMS24-J13 TaxID=3238686 RepID=UPI00384A7694
MTRRLLAATCLTPIGLALASPALADTTISTATSTPVRTSTAASGSPDNLVVASGGTITPTSSATAVTIDSNNTVSNAGTISFSGIDNAIAIGGGGGFTSGITNSGTITVDETYTQTDTNSDGVVDGPFANGTGRYGILLSGSAPFTGSITNSGTITIKGNNSGGLVSNVGIVGNVTSSGAVTVTGDNGTGIKLGDVTGKVTISGAVTATGQNSAAVALTGNVGGQVTIHSALVATGYTSTSLPSTLTSLTADNLKQGGSALVIGGNVGGGVLLGTATSSTDTTLDADGDGIVDTSEGASSLTSYGSAPALLVGSSTQSVTLGQVASSTGGLVIGGSITASGVYAGFNATGVQLGGLGQPVTITGGVVVTGTIAATSNAKNATGIDFGSGTTAPSFTNSGAISATSTTTTGGLVRAVAIEAGASVPSIANSGTIVATPFDTTNTAYAILDSSGTLTKVSNTGTISTGSNATATLHAIDVSANTTGFTYTQSQNSSTTTAPALIGAITTGSGNDVISSSAGAITSTLTTGAGNDTLALSGSATFTGNTVFGDGNDTLTMAGTSKYTGNVTYGAGANTLTIGDTAVFSGQLLNTGANLAVTVSGGTLGLTSTGATTIGSLNVNAGTIGVAINPQTGAHTEIDVTGATAITGASTIKVSLANLVSGTATSSYTVLKSGALTGSGNLGVTLEGLPYLLDGSLTASDSAGTVAVNIQRKTAAQLGLLRSEAAAYDAVYADIAGNSQLTSLFLGFTDRASLIQRYREMLPDHAGGVFDLLYTGARNMAPSESVTPWTRVGGLALWAQQSFWNASQNAVDTPGYRGTGYGASVGGDVGLGDVGRVGLTASYIFADVKDRPDSSVNANQFSVGAYWRGDWGGLHLAGSGGGGVVNLSSTRSLASTSSAVPELLSTKGKWHGTVIQGSGRASYEAHIGALYVRPAGTISYYRLQENKHSESGGGSAYDLIVDSRKSDELAATGTVALGFRTGGGKDPDATNMTFEVEGGRREIISSAIGATTAQFAGGQSFTLLPEDRKSGYTGTVSVSVGSQLFRFVASATGEQRSGYHTVLGRVALRGIF